MIPIKYPQKWLVSKGKQPFKWMIWGYPYVRKPPFWLVRLYPSFLLFQYYSHHRSIKIPLCSHSTTNQNLILSHWIYSSISVLTKINLGYQLKYQHFQHFLSVSGIWGLLEIGLSLVFPIHGNPIFNRFPKFNPELIQHRTSLSPPRDGLLPLSFLLLPPGCCRPGCF